MKWLLRRNEYIKAMSVSKSKAEELASRYSDTVAEHLAKCVIYGDETNNLTHWIREIGHKIYLVNNITLKPSGKKMKPQVYENTIFDSMGTTEMDVNILLEDMAFRYVGKYPKFSVTEELVHKVYMVFERVKKLVVPILVSNNSYTSDDFETLVKQALDSTDR